MSVVRWAILVAALMAMLEGAAIARVPAADAPVPSCRSATCLV